MSDRRLTPSPPDESPPAWLADALRRPVAVDGARAERVMTLVRAAPRPRRASPFRLAPRAPRWATRRGVLAPGGGAVLAAVFAAFLWLGGAVPTPPAAGGMSATVLRDTVLGDALQDTLRLVRLMLTAPRAERVVASGPFGPLGAPGDAAPLQRDPRTGAWTATVIVPRDAVDFAFVVDGRQVAGPSVPAAERRARLTPPASLPGDTT